MNTHRVTVVARACGAFILLQGHAPVIKEGGLLHIPMTQALTEAQQIKRVPGARSVPQKL